MARLLRHRPAHDLADRESGLGIRFAHRGRIVFADRLDDILVGLSRERPLSGERLIGDGAERELIRQRIRRRHVDVLGGEVIERAGVRSLRRGEDAASQAEVGNLGGFVLHDEYIAGLHVAVNESFVVRRREADRGLADDAHHGADGERALALGQHAVERDAVEQRHDEERADRSIVLDLAAVVDADQVRVIEPVEDVPHRADLVEARVNGAIEDQLEGDLAFGETVERLVHHAQRAAPQFFLKDVSFPRFGSIRNHFRVLTSLRCLLCYPSCEYPRNRESATGPVFPRTITMNPIVRTTASVRGPKGSPNVFVNNQPALRVTDTAFIRNAAATIPGSPSTAAGR